MPFTYQRSLRQARWMHLGIAAAVLFGLWGAAFFLQSLETNPIAPWVGKCLLGISLLGLPLFLIHLARLFRGRGAWRIEIAGGEIIWQVPEGIGEDGFRLALADIAQVNRVDSPHANGFSEYFLELKDGRSIPLSPNSLINLEKLCRALEAEGVAYRCR